MTVSLRAHGSNPGLDVTHTIPALSLFIVPPFGWTVGVVHGFDETSDTQHNCLCERYGLEQNTIIISSTPVPKKQLERLSHR